MDCAGPSRTPRAPSRTAGPMVPGCPPGRCTRSRRSGGGRCGGSWPAGTQGSDRCRASRPCRPRRRFRCTGRHPARTASGRRCGSGPRCAGSAAPGAGPSRRRCPSRETRRSRDRRSGSSWCSPRTAARCRGVVGIERDRQETLLGAARRHPARDVEELRHDAVVEDLDGSLLLDDEHACGVAGRSRDERGLVELPDRDELDPARRGLTSFCETCGDAEGAHDCNGGRNDAPRERSTHSGTIAARNVTSSLSADVDASGHGSFEPAASLRRCSDEQRDARPDRCPRGRRQRGLPDRCLQSAAAREEGAQRQVGACGGRRRGREADPGRGSRPGRTPTSTRRSHSSARGSKARRRPASSAGCGWGTLRATRPAPAGFPRS